MKPRHVVVALVLVVAAVAVQTTLFAKVTFFDVAPQGVIVVLIAVARWMDPEPAVLLGFTAGFVLDLLGGAPLGLWAFVMTTVAYFTVRLADRASDSLLVLAAGVFGVTLGAHLLFALLGTLFGQQTLSDTSIYSKSVLASTYSVALAAPVLPLVTRALGQGPRRGWDL